MRKQSNYRFAFRLDKLMWFIILMLPVLTYFVMYFHSEISVSFLEYQSAFRFDFIADILERVFVSLEFPLVPIVPFISYMVGVEVIHCFYDFIVFIPRLAHKWVGRVTEGD